MGGHGVVEDGGVQRPPTPAGEHPGGVDDFSHGVEDALGAIGVAKTRAPVGEHRVVDAFVVEGQPARHLPADAVPHRLGHLAVRQALEAQGFEVTVAWARTRCTDIVATQPGSRLVLEAKGEVAVELLQPQQVHYFLGALGELVQCMDDPDSTYGRALPDNRQYRGLVSRLPSFARDRLGLRVFFVSRSSGRIEVTEE